MILIVVCTMVGGAVGFGADERLLDVADKAFGDDKVVEAPSNALLALPLAHPKVCGKRS